MPLPPNLISEAEQSKYTQFDHLLTIQKALKEAKEIASTHLQRQKEQMKRTFDRHRRPLKIEVKDFAYVYYPCNLKLLKLHQSIHSDFSKTGIGTTLFYATEPYNCSPSNAPF